MVTVNICWWVAGFVPDRVLAVGMAWLKVSDVRKCFWFISKIIGATLNYLQTMMRRKSPVFVERCRYFRNVLKRRNVAPFRPFLSARCFSNVNNCSLWLERDARPTCKAKLGAAGRRPLARRRRRRHGRRRLQLEMHLTHTHPHAQHILLLPWYGSVVLRENLGI